MLRKKVVVQVEPSHLGRLHDVADGLQNAGLAIVDRIDSLGRFSGLAEEGSLDRLSAVPGVKSIRSTGDEGEPDPADYSIS